MILIPRAAAKWVAGGAPAPERFSRTARRFVTLRRMGRPRAAHRVKLIVGLLAAETDVLRRARQKLAHRFGAIDLESTPLPFSETDFYAAEMGAPLTRQFLAFESLVRPDDLAEIKQVTNALERDIADERVALDILRPANIDPGYVELSKLVLATTKDRAHRIYLSGGIWAEVTLQFHDGAWTPQPWTYPDYRRTDYHDFLSAVRDRLRAQRRAAETADDTRAPATGGDET